MCLGLNLLLLKVRPEDVTRVTAFGQTTQCKDNLLHANADRHCPNQASHSAVGAIFHEDVKVTPVAKQGERNCV